MRPNGHQAEAQALKACLEAQRKHAYPLNVSMSADCDGRNLPDAVVLSEALRQFCQQERIGNWGVDGQLVTEVHLSLPQLALGLGRLADKAERSSPFSQLWNSRGTNNKLYRFMKRYLPAQAMTVHSESLIITLNVGFPRHCAPSEDVIVDCQVGQFEGAVQGEIRGRGAIVAEMLREICQIHGFGDWESGQLNQMSKTVISMSLLGIFLPHFVKRSMPYGIVWAAKAKKTPLHSFLKDLPLPKEEFEVNQHVLTVFPTVHSADTLS